MEMRLPGLLALFCLVAALLRETEALPTFLSCERGFGPGNVIMAGPGVLSTERSAVFVRDGIEVDCGGTYVPGETLVGKLSSVEPGERFLMEVAGGAFVDDGGCEGEHLCGGTRCGKSTDEGQALVAPTDGSVLELTIGWTTAWGVVLFTEACALESVTPTSYPTWIEQEERILIENETMMPTMMPYDMMMNMTNETNATLAPTFIEMDRKLIDANETLAPTMMMMMPDDDNSTNTTMNYSMPTMYPTYFEFEDARVLITNETETMAPTTMFLDDDNTTIFNDTMPNMTR